jgi:hypothetical protein
MPSRFPILLGLLCCLLGNLVLAQGKKIKLRALCASHADNIREVFLVTGKTENPTLVPVPLYKSAYSDEIEVILPSKDLVFVIKTKGRDGVEQLKTVARGTAPDSTRQLALFLPSGNEEVPYKTTIIDESEASFPLGSTLLFNLSENPARFTIGEHGKDLAPGQHGIVPKPTKVNALNQCTVRLYNQRNGEWTMISSTGWKVHEEMRNLALTYIHPRTKRPTVNCFQEVPPWRLMEIE